MGSVESPYPVALGANVLCFPGSLAGESCVPECQPAMYLSREPRRCETCPASTGTSLAPQHPSLAPQHPVQNPKPLCTRCQSPLYHPEPRQSVLEGKQSQVSSMSCEVYVHAGKVFRGVFTFLLEPFFISRSPRSQVLQFNKVAGEAVKPSRSDGRWLCSG